MSFNVSTPISVKQGSQFQDSHSQRKTLASSNINLSRIKTTNNIFALWHKVNFEMGLLVPLSTLNIEDKKSIKVMKKRWSQHKCAVDGYENLEGRSSGNVSTGTFQEK